MDDYMFHLLLIVLSVNVILFLGQLAVTDLSNQMGQTPGVFYNPQGSIICNLERSNCTGTNYALDTTNWKDKLPENPTIVDQIGNFFTDIFNSIRGFFMDLPGVSYVYNLVSAPYNFLVVLGLPTSFVVVVSTMWYGLTLFVIVAFMWGR